MMAEFSEREIEVIQEYQSVKNEIERWGEFVDRSLVELLSPLIEAKTIQILPKCRVKNDQSYMTKVLYRREYKNPLLQAEDKVGTRAVMLTSRDVVEAKKIIQTCGLWQCKVGNDFRDNLEAEPDVFTYQSLHLIVHPTGGYDAPEGLYPILTCEIQLRTLLQHAYAELSHDNIYKGSYKGDREILRTLAKSMALMETTDDQFCHIFDMMNDENRPYRMYLKELGKLFKSINSDYDADLIDRDLNDTLLTLLTRKDVTLETLEKFVAEDQKFLKGGIRKKNGLLFQQPAILLIAYYLKKFEPFLRREWPLSNDSLLNLFKSFGVSFGQY